jgi:hypothetical protein
MNMNISTIVKAIIAALGAGLIPAGLEASAGSVTATTIVGSVISALVAGVAIYVKPKGKQDAGVVVTLKTDASKFLATFTAGLAGLVEDAARAALAPEPTPTFAGQVATANLTNSVVDPIAPVAPDTILSLPPTAPVA